VIRVGSIAFLLCAAAVLQVSPAFAQPATPASFRFEGGVGIVWDGGQSMGTRTATETTGSGGTSPLFSTSSELGGAAGIDGRVGVRLSPSFVVEAEASYLKPQLRIAISADAEGAAPVTASETIEQFTIGANLRWMLPGRRWSPRFRPFALAGGGYLRQLHEQATLLETGHFYQFGGGVEALLVPARRFHTQGIGVRADLRALVRAQGVAFDGGSETSPAAGASAFVRF
jgi:hypothetical protein